MFFSLPTIEKFHDVIARGGILYMNKITELYFGIYSTAQKSEKSFSVSDTANPVIVSIIVDFVFNA